MTFIGLRKTVLTLLVCGATVIAQQILAEGEAFRERGGWCAGLRR